MSRKNGGAILQWIPAEGRQAGHDRVDGIRCGSTGSLEVLCHNREGERLTITSTDPDPKHVSTSYVERQNLTMSMRRFPRLTNAFSKKLENHAAMVALYFMYYNFARVHHTWPRQFDVD